MVTKFNCSLCDKIIDINDNSKKLVIEHFIETHPKETLKSFVKMYPKKIESSIIMLCNESEFSEYCDHCGKNTLYCECHICESCGQLENVCDCGWCGKCGKPDSECVC